MADTTKALKRIQYEAVSLADAQVIAMEARAALAAQEQAEPVALSGGWEGAEYWMPLAWELCADECGEASCNELVWEGGPIPEPWGERWLKYEDEAKRLIALVHKHAPHPPAAQPVVVPLQGGMTNIELAIAAAEKLPGAKLSDSQMSALAVGVEIGMSRAMLAAAPKGGA